MKLVQSKKANINYLAKIVDIQSYFSHPNPEVTRMKCAKVDGYTVCVGIDEEIGKYVYFPVSCTINPELLSHCCLYRHKEKNSNPDKTGFFEDNGRVKAIKLKGLPSEGFLLPFNVFQDFLLASVNKTIDEDCVGTEFDSIEHNGKEFWICKKYIVEHKISTPLDKNAKRLKGYNKIIDTQFRLHYDTVLLRKQPFFVNPEDRIHISSKIHGCVDRETILETSQGLFTIGEIYDKKLKVDIAAYDIDSRQKVFVPIDNYYKLEDDGDWLEIELENGQKLKITTNNPVYLPEFNCYRRADALKVGDGLLFSKF